MKIVTPKLLRVLLYSSILLNVFDIVLHVVINQPEVLRIVGNILIIVGSGIALLKQRSSLALIVGLVFYLIANGVFIALSGIGGAGMAFISLTTLLTLVSVYLQKLKL